MLETFDSDLSHFDPRNKFAGDENLPVQFRIDALRDDAASAAAGRPIFRDVEWIKIFVNKDSIIDRPVRDEDKQRFPRAYAAFKQSGESDPGATGTRLEHWPLMSRAQVEEFRFFKVFTIEQLAELPDNIASQIMGAVKLKQMARLAVEAAKGEAPLVKLQGEIEKRDGQIAELTAEVARLTKMVEEKLKLPAAPAAETA